jgi:TldD protein
MMPANGAEATMAAFSFETRYGIDDGLLRRLLSEALARGGTFCDLFFQKSLTNLIALEDDAVNRAYRSSSLGMGVRVVDGDSTGYAFSEELEEESLLEAARVASAIARSGAGASVAPEKIVRVAPQDLYPTVRPWEEVTTVEKLPILTRLNALAFGLDPSVVKVRVRLADSHSEVLVVDSEGRRTADSRPMTTLSASCVCERGGRREENGHTVAGRVGLELYGGDLVEEVAREAVRRTVLLFEAVRPPPGEMPVVLAAGSSGILLHEAIGHGMEADFNRKGTSIYEGRIGKPVARPFVSIVDDGTIPAARGSVNVDDEGSRTERTVLVEDGVLRTYLHDRISARHYGVAPTGNGRRESFRHAPMPRMRCTIMLPGPHSREEIIRSVDRGVYAETFSNGQVQIGAGDFTFFIKSGCLIEGGRLTAPIKDVNIIGNGPRVLSDVVMVGDDFVLDRGGWTCGKEGQSVPVSLGMPTVKVSSITVGGVG